MAERKGASHQAARYLPYQVDENPEKQAARYGAVEQEEQDEPSTQSIEAVTLPHDTPRRQSAVIEEHDALHVVATPRYSRSEQTTGQPAVFRRNSYSDVYPEPEREDMEREESEREDAEQRPYEGSSPEHSTSSPRSERYGAAPEHQSQSSMRAERGRQRSRQRGGGGRERKATSRNGGNHLRQRPAYHLGRRPWRLLSYRPTRNLWRILRTTATEPIVRATRDRPEIQQAATYTRTTIRSAALVSRWVSRITHKSLKLILSVKFLLPVLLIIVFAVVILFALTSTNSLDSNVSLLSDTYKYVTRLDAETEQSILRSARQHNTDTVYINGVAVPIDQFQIQTNIDYLLMYLQVRHETLKLGDPVDGYFGGSFIRDEIKAIHGQLYSWWIETEEIETGNDEDSRDDDGSEEPEVTTVSVVQLAMQPVASFITANAQLSDNEIEQMRLISASGVYMASSTIGAPFDGYYYIKDRWGWYIAGDTRLSERDGITVLPYSSCDVLCCYPGNVIEVSSGHVTVRVGEDRVRYSNLHSITVEVGQSVQQGQVLGHVAYDTGLYLEYFYDHNAVNPLFLLPSKEIGSGDGSALVAVASEQVGNVGGQPYWSWYGFGNRVDWCAIFVSWCANEISVLDKAIPKFAGVGSGASWFRARGQWQYGGIYIPQPGDIVFFDWECDGDLDHTGIVEACDGILVHTIEGNTGNHPGSCSRKDYPIASPVIVGYGIPEY